MGIPSYSVSAVRKSRCWMQVQCVNLKFDSLEKATECFRANVDFGCHYALLLSHDGDVAFTQREHIASNIKDENT